MYFHQQDQRWHNLGRGSIDQTTPQIDWLTESKTLLEEHKQRLSSNPLQGLQPKNFDVYVPLGLVKREKKERPQVDRNLDPSPERGSDFYRVETTPIERNELKQNFEIFRTLDFKYTSPAGDEVEAFILKWFGDDPAAGKKLRLALDETGKERIKDLAQNPLRLTLLCNIWLRKLGLPDTQAGLYKQFVDYVYEWKSDTFPNAAKLRGRLDRSIDGRTRKIRHQ